MKPHKLLFTTLLFALCSLQSFSQIPRTLSYQGVLTDSLGNPKPDGSYSLTFRLYDAEASGSVLWTEVKTLDVKRGLFTTVLGDQALFGAAVKFDKPYWLSIQVASQPELAPRIPLSAVAYSLNSLKADTAQFARSAPSQSFVDSARIAGTVPDGIITSTKIQNSTIQFADIAQNGAASGQVMKWNGTAWAPATDATGGGSGGWSDNGTQVELATSSDTVNIGSSSPIGKLHVNGDIGLSSLSSIKFGNDANRITATSGDMRLVSEDLSMLTTGNITFGHYGDETWIEFDNANKRVGIGTLSPTDRLHVVQNVATAGLSAIKGVATPTTVSNNGVWGESMSPTGYGLYGKSPKYGTYGLATGNQGRGVIGEAINPASIGVQGIATNTSSTGVWGEGSNQGVYGFSSSATGKGVYGKVTSADGYSGYFEGGKFYVKGSAEVRDTLFADALKIANSPRVFYKKGSYQNITAQDSWGPLDTIIVDVPGPGYVILNFSGRLSTNHTYLDYTWAGVGISTSPTGGVLAQTWWSFPNELAGGIYETPCAVNTVATITSAGTYNYYIVGYHWSHVGGTDEDVERLYHGSFSALFIPAP